MMQGGKNCNIYKKMEENVTCTIRENRIFEYVDARNSIV
jgi:hypothetical protein